MEYTVNVFNGQPASDMAHYRIDLGKRNSKIIHEGEDSGFRNADIELSNADLLSNIKDAQVKNLIKTSNALSTGVADLKMAWNCVGLKKQKQNVLRNCLSNYQHPKFAMELLISLKTSMI